VNLTATIMTWGEGELDPNESTTFRITNREGRQHGIASTVPAGMLD